MSKTCAKAFLQRQFPGEDSGEALTEIRKRLQLLEGEKKANYETAELEKKNNEVLVKKLKSELNQLKEQKACFGKDERLMRDALEGQATGGDLYQRLEPRDILDTKANRLGDLTNKLNMLRARKAKRTKDLATMMVVFKNSVIDNIIYEENRQPEEVHLRQLNNEIDCVSRKLIEAQHINEKYRDVITSLRNEQMTYMIRLGLLHQRIDTATATSQRVQQSLQHAQSMQQESHQLLTSSQQLSSQLRKERDGVLAGHKQKADEQKTEYQQIRKQIFLTGGPEDQLPPNLSSVSVMQDRRMSVLVDEELSGLYSRAKEIMKLLGAWTVGDLVKLFEMQADTAQQLSMVWKDTEASIKNLRKRKVEAEQVLENLRYQDNMQDIRERELCRQLHAQIADNLASKKMSEDNEEHLIISLGGVRTGLVHMIDLLNDSGISVMNIVVQHKIKPPSLQDLFNAVTVAIQFLTTKMDSISVGHMMVEMDKEDFFASRSEQLALEGKVRGLPPIQPPEKKRFSFLLIDRPDVIDEGPGVMTRAQIKHTSRIMVEARAPKIRPPTARDLRKHRRRSTIIDRPLQAMN